MPGCLVIILIIIVLYLLLSRCGASFTDQTGQVDQAQQGSSSLGFESALPTETPTLAALPTATPRPRNTAAVSAKPSSWLVMLYQDADDKVLEKDIYVDLNEAERVGSTDQVHIVSQIDRYAGGTTEDGNWTGSRRYYVTQDQDLNRIGSQLVDDLGEVNMADGATLVDFVTWAIQTYPADRLVLILSDHGMGWPGGWSDPAPSTVSERGTALAAAAGNQLYLNELDSALGTIRQKAGIDRFELIGLDACLMGQIEVYSMLSAHARYAVASEETEPGLGWAYAGFLQALVDNPAMNGADLSREIVDRYIVGDERILDEAARQELLRQGSPMSSLFGFSLPSSAQVANQMGRDVTLSAVDLGRMPGLMSAVNDLCLAMQGGQQQAVAKARNYALSFTNVFSQETPSPYIDLGSFVQLLQQTNTGSEVKAAAANVLTALQSAVVAEKHGMGKQGATGMAIYYPNSTLYRTPATGPSSYTVIADQFARTSLWDDFLAFHYTGRAFEATAQQAAVPSASAAVSGPGQSELTMSAVRASGAVAAPGKPIVLSADISGQNLGYVLLFAGYYDREANSLYVADMDYLESDDTREVDGIYYPVWPEEVFTLEFEWEPLVYYISDGTTTVPAQLTPASYGASAEEAVYTVDGVYAYASGEAIRARLYFQNGELQKVYGLAGSSSAASPTEIYPQSGDQFTVYHRWLDLDAQGRVVKQAAKQGDTLTFGDQMFTWEELDAAAGDYVVGFIAQDLDGNQRQAYTRVTVR